MNLTTKLYGKYRLSKASDEAIFERYGHSLSVALTAVDLVKRFDRDDLIEKAFVAGVLHDYAKFLSNDQYEFLIEKYNLDNSLLKEGRKTWHGKIGVYAVIDELDITDSEIIGAIKYHVVGRPDMSFLEKVIYVADYIEPMRIGNQYETARKYAFEDLDKAVAIIAKSVYEYLRSSGCETLGETYETFCFYQKYL